MIKSLMISLILTIFIELYTSILIGIKKRNDIITVIVANTLTNPIVVFTTSTIQNNLNNVWLYWGIVIIIEIIVVFIEGKLYEKIINFKKISGFKLSLINNVASFMIGIIIVILSS